MVLCRYIETVLGLHWAALGCIGLHCGCIGLHWAALGCIVVVLWLYCGCIGDHMLAKTMVVFCVWFPNMFIIYFIYQNFFHALLILICIIKHYQTIVVWYGNYTMHCGCIMALIWLYYGFVVAVLWLYCRYTVATLWLHCGCIVAV